MTPRQPTRRSLQLRLALGYAAGIYLAGIVVLLLVVVPLAQVQAATPTRQQAPTTTTERGISLSQLLAGAGVALVVLIPVALGLGWFVAGRFLDPLRAITATAQHISAGNLDQRLDLGEPTDELTQLGHTLDGLFARLQAAFDAQRHFVANASHELRTPLTGLRTLLEVTLADPDADTESLRAACREALALTHHQERLVHALLVLATSERGISRWDTFDLAQITRRVIASRHNQAAERGIDLAETLSPVVTAGDPRLIESLITNLIDNAVRHNHPCGRLHVTTEAAGSGASITVTNTGPVIPEGQLQRLFQPFERLSSNRHEGHGLGLAIVNAVAQAHHATVTTNARTEGGLVVTVRFSATPQPGQRRPRPDPRLSR